MKMKQPRIVIDRDFVEIESTWVPRPDDMSPSQWLEFWEEATQDVVYE